MSHILYLKAAHIIFVCTWFAGLFYIVRLFIYYTEAKDKEPTERQILQDQLGLMMNRLWKIITVPSAVITLLLGLGNWYFYGWTPDWLYLKLIFVVALYLYHLYLGLIRRRLLEHVYTWNSYQLRLWNELATIFLFAIVLLAVVKNMLSPVYGILGLIVLMILLYAGIKIYSLFRKK